MGKNFLINYISKFILKIFFFLGTHWIRVSNNDSKNFALLPIFAFDDDYVPLSPVVTPSPEDKPTKQKSPKINTDAFIPVLTGKDLTTISETSESLASRGSTSSPAQIQTSHKEITPLTSPRISHESHINGRKSPEVQVLDITDLNDPGVRIVSKFSFKDVDNKFYITIYGKNKSI